MIPIEIRIWVKKHKILLIMSLLVILTVLIVLIIEHFNAISFQGIGGIATLLTVIYLALTLDEMKNQRESLYKPDVILRSCGHFYMYSEKNLSVILPSLWSTEKIDYKTKSIHDLDRRRDVEFIPDLGVDQKKDIKRKPFYKAVYDSDRNKIGIPIINIGMGAAKNIQIEWKIPKKHEVIMYVHNENKTKKIWSSRIPSRSTFDKNTEMYSSIDYLIASTMNSPGPNEKQEIFIPYEFQLIFNEILTLEIDSIESKSYELPELVVSIKYTDLANESHQKKFLIHFKLIACEKKINEPPQQKRIVDNIEMSYQITEIL